MNIVFDLGAVVLTWEPVSLIQSALPQHAPTAQAAHTLASAMFHHEDWLGFDRGTHGLDVAIGRMALRLALPRDRLDELLAPMGERLAPIDSSIELLDTLRRRRDATGDLRLFYLSNMPAPYARALEARHGFFEWFDGGIFSADVGIIKPQSAIYELLATRHRLEPSTTLFIDDSLANVKAARLLGWHAIHCTATHQLATQVAAYLPPLSCT